MDEAAAHELIQDYIRAALPARSADELRKRQDFERTITAPQAEQILGVKAATVRAWASRGLIYAVDVQGPGGRRHYRLSDILAVRDRHLDT